jgi:pimeloyl-ACP methyl ester carboxylesterase
MSTRVVLVHGFATDSARTWRENGWLDLLADVGREPIAIDLLGHGTADKPHDPDAYADLEGYVLDRFPDEPVDAIGFSLGARVLLTIASRHPERFERLVVMGIGAQLMQPDESDPETSEMVLRAIEGDGDRDNPVTQYFAGLASHAGVDREALAACLRAERPPVTRELLAAVTVPVLVVIGDQDFAGPGEPIADGLPNATLKTLRHVDHFATPKDFGCLDAALAFIDATP